MPKIERRHRTVSLYVGNYQNDLAELLNQAMAAQRAEESSGSRRANTRSKAIALAKQYDELLAEAEASAIKVDIYEISNAEWQQLADEHPPCEGDATDQRNGVNMKTFCPALLRASVRDSDIDLNELSRLHYDRLERSAWNLHAEDDALPKFSLVSLLKQARDPDSKPPEVSE